jgi:hypothetical protein
MAPIKKPLPKCQCTDENGNPCTDLALNNSLFCANHQNCKPSPTNGYEPKYEPETFNNDPAVYKAINCYSYSMNVKDPGLINQCRANKGKDCRKLFHQPGALHGDRYALNTEARRTCAVVEDLMKKDVPEIQKTTFDAICPKGMSKIALVVDKGEDYHYYRQDGEDEDGMKAYLRSKGFIDRGVGLWSHKDGSNKVKRFDALKRPIFNPQTAARDYQHQGSDLNYEDFCGFYCVPRSKEVHLGQGGMRKAGGGKTRRASRQSIAGLSWRDHHRRASRRKQTRRLL